MVGTSEGFIGCVHSLRVGRRPIEFDVEKDPLIQSMRKVFQCPVRRLSNEVSTTTMDSFNEPAAAAEEERDGEDDGEFANQISPVIATLTEPSGLVSFKINPCLRRNPCQNHGLCWNDNGSSRGYKCICHPEFSGELLSL